MLKVRWRWPRDADRRSPAPRASSSKEEGKVDDGEEDEVRMKGTSKRMRRWLVIYCYLRILLLLPQKTMLLLIVLLRRRMAREILLQPGSPSIGDPRLKGTKITEKRG